MNVDKFGHHVHKRLRVLDFFDIYNEALIKSDSGDFDLKQKRLRGLKNPVFEDEAVNKQFLDFTLKQYYTKKEFDSRVKTTVESHLKQFKEKLHEALFASYYTKPEIDQMLASKNE